MKLKRERDRPFDEAYLLGELQLRNPDLVPMENALTLLLGKKLE